MSIYSGLPTRKHEQSYNKLLSKLLRTMQTHLLELTNGKISLKYFTQYTRIINKMEAIEEHKYLPPKFAGIVEPFLTASRQQIQKVTDIRKQKKLEEVKEQEQELDLQEEKKSNSKNGQIMPNQKQIKQYPLQKIKSQRQKNPTFQLKKFRKLPKPLTNYPSKRSSSMLGHKVHQTFKTEPSQRTLHLKTPKEGKNKISSYLEHHGFKNPFPGSLEQHDFLFIYK